MEKQLKNEIRKLLTGRTIRDEDGWLIAVPDGNRFIYHGITDRMGYRRIRVKEEHIQVANSSEEAFQPVLNALGEIGLPVDMKMKPTALCALCRVFLTRRVLLCVLPEDDGMVLVQAYTGRAITSRLCCHIAISRFMKKIKEERNS